MTTNDIVQNKQLSTNGTANHVRESKTVYEQRLRPIVTDFLVHDTLFAQAFNQPAILSELVTTWQDTPVAQFLAIPTDNLVTMIEKMLAIRLFQAPWESEQEIQRFIEGVGRPI